VNTSTYRDVIIRATLTKREVKPAIEEVVKEAVLDAQGNIKTPAEYKNVEPAVYQLEIVTPFVRYVEHVFMDGVDVTYSYRTNLTLEGREVVVITSVIDQHPTRPSEVDKALAYKDTIAKTWAEAQAHPTFQKHYKPTNADAISVTKEDQTVVKYSGKDAAQLCKPYALFCESMATVKAEQDAVVAKQAALVAAAEPIEEPIEEKTQ